MGPPYGRMLQRPGRRSDVRAELPGVVAAEHLTEANNVAERRHDVRIPEPRNGGGCGIRTREGLHPTRFPSVRTRPLCESSGETLRQPRRQGIDCLPTLAWRRPANPQGRKAARVNGLRPGARGSSFSHLHLLGRGDHVSLALYRKYRPGRFADVVGQEQVTGPLLRAPRKRPGASRLPLLRPTRLRQDVERPHPGPQPQLRRGADAGAVRRLRAVHRLGAQRPGIDRRGGDRRRHPPVGGERLGTARERGVRNPSTAGTHLHHRRGAPAHQGRRQRAAKLIEEPRRTGGASSSPPPSREKILPPSVPAPITTPSGWCRWACCGPTWRGSANRRAYRPIRRRSRWWLGQPRAASETR